MFFYFFIFLCLFSLVLCLFDVYKHDRLLELGFSFMLYFSVSCFWVRVLNKSHAHMPEACVRRLNPTMHASGCACRYLTRNPNSDFLCCLVRLFHMFCLCLSPPFFLNVYTHLSLCLVCLLISNVFRLGFHVYVSFKYHDHSFTCPCTMLQVLKCYKVSKVGHSFTCTYMLFV